MQSGGHCLVECLARQGVARVFCVPGESYLDVLDGLHGSSIQTIVARHEGAAAMMAEADGKMTGRPGVAMVTRGPGATNAAAGIHVAMQDSTPMVLLVGQIGRAMRGRDAFQEVDFRAFFSPLAKWAEEIDQADRIPEILSHAWHIALSGRPGPVVLALPEDMLRDNAANAPGPRITIAEPYPAPDDLKRFCDLLSNAKSPIVIAGGSRWTEKSAAQLQSFVERLSLPVATSFRRQQLFDAGHPNYAGDVGLGINPALKSRIEASDCVVLLGGRFSENPSQGFTLLDIPDPRQTLVHIHPGPEELGRIYTPDLAINATPGSFLAGMEDLPPAGGWKTEADAAHQAYRQWTDSLPEGVGRLTMSHVVTTLRDRLAPEAIVTNGAGNYAIWLNRYYRYRWGTQLAPTSGSMGYGLPAAIAAALRQPDRPVVCLAGDGCFQMTGMEFGVAVQHGLKIVVLVCDNSMYGTIRMHQEKTYPGRVSATGLVNPDFAAWAQSYGAFGRRVEADGDFGTALDAAMSADGPALLHLVLDPRDIAPGRTIAADHNIETDGTRPD